MRIKPNQKRPRWRGGPETTVTSLPLQQSPPYHCHAKETSSKKTCLSHVRVGGLIAISHYKEGLKRSDDVSISQDGHKKTGLFSSSVERNINMEGNCEGKLLLRKKGGKKQPERMVSHNVNGMTFRRTVQLFQKQNTHKKISFIAVNRGLSFF